MKIISKKGRIPPSTKVIPIPEVSEFNLQVMDSQMTPEEIAHIEEVFKNIRKQLEQIGGVIT